MSQSRMLCSLASAVAIVTSAACMQSSTPAGRAAAAPAMAPEQAMTPAPAVAAAPAPAPVPSATPEAPPEIAVGMMAPDFTIPWADARGPSARPVKLSDLRGRVVVLAFYPADKSSGCTHELTKFRDEYATMFGQNTFVLPISNDNLATHAVWAKEMNFPFALGTDADLQLARTYGSFTPGRTNANRTVFVIGKDGRILWRNLKFGALNEGAYTELAAEVARAQ